MTLYVRFERAGSATDLDQAITAWREAVMATPDGHPNRAGRLSNLGSALRARFERSGSLADLEEAITVTRQALAATRDDSPGRAVIMSNLGVAMQERFDWFGSLTDLEEAITVTRQALAATRDDHSGRTGILANLAAALHARFERSDSLADLDEAITAARQAVAATSINHPDRAGRLSNLGTALQSRFVRSGALGDLEEAITAARQAVASTPGDHPGRARHLSNLGKALTHRFRWSGSLDDLNEAVTVGRQAVAGTPGNHPERARRLSDLGVALSDRFQRSGSVADLDEAITAARQAVDATPANHPERATRLSNLGSALHSRFQRSGSREDLDEAILAISRAVTMTPSGHAERAAIQSNLSVAFNDRFQRSGSLGDLNEAITAARQAVAATPGDHPDRARRLSNLGTALQIGFQRSGSLADLDEAITAGRQTVDATPGDHPDRARWLSNLGSALRSRFQRSGSLGDLDEAITVGRQAVDATPGDHPDRATRLSNLGSVVLSRFYRSESSDDLDEAIAADRHAAALIPDDQPTKAAILSNLGVVLHSRFQRSGSIADLEEAITSARHAVAATPLDAPDRAARLSNLGSALRSRFELSGAVTDLDEAITAGLQAAAMDVAPPVIRVLAARGGAKAAASARRWPEAATGYGTAVSLLGLVAPRSLARSDQEDLLGDLAGLASDAAACCVLASQPERAVELLEQGRAILLGQALDTRTDVTGLAEQHPELAERFAALREAFDQAGRGGLPGPPVHAGQAADLAFPSWREAEQQRLTAAAFEQLITQIRDQPGFAGFLRPTPVRELREAAADGPIVIVNVSSFGSHALIVTTGGVLAPVPLDGVTPSDVNTQVTELIAAFAYHPGRADPDTQLTAILRWLWEAIASPVLDRLGFTGRPPDGQAWPRLWWCLPGLLSFLPVHAAGDHETRASATPQTVIDRAVCSYTPTIRALLHVRRSRPVLPSLASDVLVVAVPHTPGAPDLPGAQEEARRLRQRLGSGVTILTGGQATRDAVINRLPAARWAHFACHGAADLTSPSASHLLLAGHQQLTVTDIARLRLVNADMAYLSACSTAQPGTHLADEAIHLASAFQLAGYRHVIGTLWPVSDHAAVTIADQIYVGLARATPSVSAARALHAVTRSQRDHRPRTPAAWASHVHIGP